MTRIEHWQTESSSYVHQAPLFNLRSDIVRLPRGRAIDGYVVLETSPWVTVVAVTDDDDLVLVRQYRHALGQVSLELPGGAIDDDEDPIAGGQRELLEETGYGRGSWRRVLTVAPNPALQNNWDHFVLAAGVEQVSEPSPDETEDLVVELRPRATAPAMIDSGEIIHALHVAALLVCLREQGQ